MDTSEERVAELWQSKCPTCGLEYNDHEPPIISDEALRVIVSDILKEFDSSGVHEDFIGIESLIRALKIFHPVTVHQHNMVS